MASNRLFKIYLKIADWAINKKPNLTFCKVTKFKKTKSSSKKLRLGTQQGVRQVGV
jgi:hypothetical protein